MGKSQCMLTFARGKYLQVYIYVWLYHSSSSFHFDSYFTLFQRIFMKFLIKHIFGTLLWGQICLNAFNMTWKGKISNSEFYLIFNTPFLFFASLCEIFVLPDLSPLMSPCALTFGGKVWRLAARWAGIYVLGLELLCDWLELFTWGQTQDTRDGWDSEISSTDYHYFILSPAIAGEIPDENNQSWEFQLVKKPRLFEVKTWNIRV